MTIRDQTVYPLLIASIDVGLAGLLLLIAPLLGVVMGAVGLLVICALACRTVGHARVPTRSRSPGDNTVTSSNAFD